MTQPSTTTGPAIPTKQMARTVIEAILARTDGLDWSHPSLRDLADKCHNIREIYYRRHRAKAEQWVLIKECAASFHPPVDANRLCIDLLTPDVMAFGHRSFIDGFDLAEDTAQSTIKDYSGKYMHVAPALTREGFIVSQCDLLSSAWEKKLPAYNLRRKEEHREYLFTGGYFHNDHQLFLIGSRDGFPDARLHVFNINYREDEDILEGVMAGVSHGGVPFASRCCLISADDFELEDTDGIHQLDDLKRLSTLAYDFFQSGEHKMVISPGGNGI
ncbi:hypothetical protein J3P71_20905 [Rhizobium leguminosarum]|uniref:hypothetical protein n=1 Tax=Rhizobium leguminosarum TaxID=384 RepID=UPI0014413C37|nr:hypothetical protein [Rhizobium leguminosarum]MBY5841307.1 hypothetical protein [Rhizobium leguminosarum]NKM80934.1 hypothetical protein [Rhizobium leguminosarum bv. viciae]QSZ07290.1 hypothetical protein J3P71_20905 [Rhizobium leguminosarum]